MANMNKDDLLTILNTGVQDTTAFDSVFMAENENLLERYLGRPYGNELPNRSSVISNDVMDVVESDLPPRSKNQVRQLADTRSRLVVSYSSWLD
jgi:hypothetical protein